MLYVVLVIGIVYCFLAYIQDNGLIVKPSFLACITITISTLFGIIGNKRWNIGMPGSLPCVVFIGLLSIFLADVLTKKTTKRKIYTEQHECKFIIINKIKLNLIYIAIIGCTFLYCIDILHAGTSMGSSGLKAIYSVKMDRAGTNIIIRQGVKFVMAAAYVHSFIFVNNVMILRNKSVDGLKNLIPIICAVICSIFTSVRTYILELLTAIIVDYCILLFQTQGWKRRSLKKCVKKIFPYIIVVLIFLVAVRFIVKGDNNATSNTYNFFEYISYYIGTPIIVMGSKLNNGIVLYKGNLFGELTFNEIWQTLNKIGMINPKNLMSGSTNIWIDKAAGITANVDTIFGAPLIDYGIWGMGIYIFILFIVLNKYYYKNIEKTKSGKNRDKSIIVYSYLAVISSMAYYGNLASMFFSTYYIITFILCLLLIRFYCKKNDWYH